MPFRASNLFMLNQSTSREEMGEIALNILRSRLASQKEWAQTLKVSESLINQWLLTKKPIAPERAEQIILKSEVFIKQVYKIDKVLREFLTRNISLDEFYQRQKRIFDQGEEALKLNGWF